MRMRRFLRLNVLAWTTLIAFSLLTERQARAEKIPKEDPYDGVETADDSLVKELEGFSNGFATVNGIQIHYVSGGQGTPVILMPGWPQTWWAFRKIMPQIAASHRVIAVNIRGMGASDKPQAGYDKKYGQRYI